MIGVIGGEMLGVLGNMIAGAIYFMATGLPPPPLLGTTR